MTSRDFCYWLQGFFEITELNKNPEKITLTKEQIEAIRNHLNMVFRHEIDPGFGKDLQDLQKIHEGTILDPTAGIRHLPTYCEGPRVNC